MAIPSRKPEKSDFDASELLANHELQENNISNLTARLSKIEGYMATPQSLAAFFQEATKDSRVLDGVFAEMFCRFLNEHEGVQEAVKIKFNEVDRHFVREKFKRWGTYATSAFLVLLGAAGREIVHWLSAFLPK